jgi:hypothetical protein
MLPVRVEHIRRTDDYSQASALNWMKSLLPSNPSVALHCADSARSPPPSGSACVPCSAAAGSGAATVDVTAAATPQIVAVLPQFDSTSRLEVAADQLQGGERFVSSPEDGLGGRANVVGMVVEGRRFGDHPREGSICNPTVAARSQAAPRL